MDAMHKMNTSLTATDSGSVIRSSLPNRTGFARGLLASRALRSAVMGALAVLFALVLGVPVAQAAQRQIYWSNNSQGSTIGSAVLDGTGVNQSFISDAQAPAGVAVDGQHIYWTNLSTGAIGRANLDGTGVNQSFISGAQAPDGVAVDGQHIYWTNFTAGTIGRANLDGTGVTQSFITGANGPFAVAVDAAHLYWTNFSAGTIGRANLDGSGVTQSFITGANGPFAVAVDAAHLYWTNFSAGTIGRANVDGTGVNQSLITDTSLTEGLADDGQHIYWGDNAGRIGEADLDGAVINPSLITGAANPEGVALQASSATLQASPGTLTFPSQAQSTVSAPQTVTLTDTGNAPLSVSGLAFAGNDPGDYIVGSSTCLGLIAPGQSCRVTVNFVPQAQGTRTATLQIFSNDPLSPASVSLSGGGGTLQTGPIGPMGPAGQQGPAGPQGTQGPAGQIELVICKTERHHYVCTGRLVSGPVKFTARSISGSATLSRGHVRYAIGSDMRTAPGRDQLMLRPLRRITPGNYLLTSKRRHRRRSTIQRTHITIR